MSQMLDSRCGIYCGECEYREKMKCPGCRAAGGNVFWGKCELASCCMEKGLENCGECSSCPCDRLKAFSYDKTQGDGGERIRNLLAWKQEGFCNWVRKRSAQK